MQRTKKPPMMFKINLKNQYLSHGVCCFVCAVGVVAPPSVGRAQVVNPTVLAPAVKLPQQREVATSISRGRRGLELPKGADKKFVMVRSVSIAGGFPELAEQNAAFVQKVEGRRLSLAEIYQAAGELQAAYSNAFPLATISAPRPDFSDGVVKLEVTDGVIERLDLAGAPEDVRELVRERVQPLVGRHHLTAAEYQRRTMLVGSLAGVSGQASTAPLNSVDGYVLTIGVVESRVSAASAVSNRLPADYGTWEFAHSFALNNALGWGEQIAGAVSSTPDFDRYFQGTAKSQAYSADVSAPIGADGLAVGAGYLMARSRPTPLFSNLPADYLDAGERLTGRYDRIYLRAAYPVFLTTDFMLRIQASAEHINNRFRFAPLPLSTVVGPVGSPFLAPFQDLYRDRYSALRLSAETKYRLPWLDNASFSGLIAFGRGLGGRLDSADYLFGPTLSRVGASPNFNRLNLKGRLDVGLPENFVFSAIGRMQTSFGRPLMLPENFLIDGPEAVSGYASGTLNADRGVTGRAELGRPFVLEFLGYNNVVSPYIFGAWGSGVREDRNPGFGRHLWAETFGGGMRASTNFTGTPYGESVAIEAGRDLSNILFRQTGYRVNFSYNLLFSGDPLAPEATPASPAGIFKKGPPDAKPSPDIWPGFYAGLNAGYTWDPLPEVVTAGVPAFLGINLGNIKGKTLAAGGGSTGGAQVGLNFQSGRIVGGIEADIQGSNARTRVNVSQLSSVITATAVNPMISSIDNTKNVDWLGTARGRLGYLLTPRLLAYATAGLAYGDTRVSTFIRQNWLGGILDAPLGSNMQSPGATGGYSGFRIGWTIGAGLEWMFAPNASIKAEWLHYNLGSVSYGLSPLINTNTTTGASDVLLPVARTHFRGDIARVGFNYHFGAVADEPPAESPAAFTQGFYAGLNAGYGWDASPSVRSSAVPVQANLDNTFFANLAATAAASATGVSRAPANGALGGGQAGYNYLIDRYLVGVETDLQGASQHGRGGFLGVASGSVGNVPGVGPVPGSSATAVQTEKTLDWFGSLRLRGGFLFTPTLLAYGTGGFAYGGATVENWVAHDTDAAFALFRSIGSVGHISTGRVGWTVGAGLEWRFAPMMSLKAEYLYYDLGRVQYSAGAIATLDPAGVANSAALVGNTRLNGQIARLGLNYHFDPIAIFPVIK